MCSLRIPCPHLPMVCLRPRLAGGDSGSSSTAAMAQAITALARSQEPPPTVYQWAFVLFRVSKVACRMASACGYGREFKSLTQRLRLKFSSPQTPIAERTAIMSWLQDAMPAPFDRPSPENVPNAFDFLDSWRHDRGSVVLPIDKEWGDDGVARKRVDDGVALKRVLEYWERQNEDSARSDTYTP